MERKSSNNAELQRIRKIIIQSGSLAYAENQIRYLFSKAKEQLNGLRMNAPYKQALDNFSQEILKI
jgi:geranylgeranyl pyrophosphate synthase